MSIDVVYTAEFANAGFLRPYTADEKARLTAGMLPAPVETGMWKDTLYAAPFKSNAQLLWYRKSLAAAAGVDPDESELHLGRDASKPLWRKTRRSPCRAPATRATWCGSTRWCSAGGGQIINDPEAGRNATPSLAGPAGEQGRGDHRQAGPLAPRPLRPVDAQEEQARATFQADQGMFMLNWPYVLAAARSAVEEGTLTQAVVDDIGWARYPRVFADKPSAPPLGGANLAIGAYSKHPDLAVALVECVNALPKATQYMLDEGEPSPYAASYDDPAVREKYPNADLIRESIAEGGPRPLTPVLRRRRRIGHPDLASAGRGQRREPRRRRTHSWPTCLAGRRLL